MDTTEAQLAPGAELPPVVAAEVHRRRVGLLERARGQVLDLDRADDRARLASAGDGGPQDPAERFDTIICTGATVRWPDLGASLAAVERWLADDGELLMVEPVGRPGWFGLATSSLGALLPQVEGLQLSRDVVATVRAVGLTAGDVERFTIATAVWPLRLWVQVRAVRIPHLHPSDRSDAPAEAADR